MQRCYIACFSRLLPLLYPDSEQIAVVLRIPAAYRSAFSLIFSPPDLSKTELLTKYAV